MKVKELVAVTVPATPIVVESDDGRTKLFDSRTSESCDIRPIAGCEVASIKASNVGNDPRLDEPYLLVFVKV
jgi:hypothetical protein